MGSDNFIDHAIASFMSHWGTHRALIFIAGGLAVKVWGVLSNLGSGGGE